jgi:hypothetical protein
MRVSRWAAAGALGWIFGMTGCASSAVVPSQGQGTENGDSAAATGDAAAETGGSTPTQQQEDASSNGEDASTSVAEAGPSEGPGDDSGPGTTGPDANSMADAAIDTGPSGSGEGAGCVGGKALSPSDAPGVMASNEYAAVKWSVSTTTQLVGLKTTMIVPAKPTAMSGTLYVWPGIQPLGNSKNYQPIGNGILQPVLSVGPTCAPGAPNDFASWWISGQYVNVSTGAAGPTGCLGGPGMDVAVGDALDIAMTLSGTVWTQLITDRQTSKSVKFDMDLKGQSQNWATLAIEIPDQLLPTSDVVYTSTELTFADSDQAACQPSQHGPTDYFATPYASQDGKTCCVSRVILRAQGVAATTKNGP